MVGAGEGWYSKPKLAGRMVVPSIQRSVFVRTSFCAPNTRMPRSAPWRCTSLVCLRATPRHFERDIDRFATDRRRRIHAQTTRPSQLARLSPPQLPRGGRHYEITASDMSIATTSMPVAGPVGIILDWTIDDAAQRLGVSTGTIKRREAELTGPRRIRRDYGRVFLSLPRLDHNLL